MQVAARKVLEENNRLRLFLREKGIDDEELDAWMDGAADGGSREGSISAGLYGGSRSVDSPAPELAGLIGLRRKCCAKEERDNDEMEERKPSLSMLAPSLGTTSQAGSVNGSTKATPILRASQLVPGPIAQSQTSTPPAMTSYHPSSTPSLAQPNLTFTPQELHLPNYDSYQVQLSQFQQYLHAQQQHQQQHSQPQAYSSQQYQTQPQLLPSQQHLGPMQQQQHPQQQRHSYNHLHHTTSPMGAEMNNVLPSMDYYNIPAPDDDMPSANYYNTLPDIDSNLNFDTPLDMDTTSSMLLPPDMQAQFLRGLNGGSPESGEMNNNNNHHRAPYQ